MIEEQKIILSTIIMILVILSIQCFNFHEVYATSQTKGSTANSGTINGKNLWLDNFTGLPQNVVISDLRLQIASTALNSNNTYNSGAGNAINTNNWNNTLWLTETTGLTPSATIKGIDVSVSCSTGTGTLYVGAYDDSGAVDSRAPSGHDAYNLLGSGSTTVSTSSGQCGTVTVNFPSGVKVPNDGNVWWGINTDQQGVIISYWQGGAAWVSSPRTNGIPNPAPTTSLQSSRAQIDNLIITIPFSDVRTKWYDDTGSGGTAGNLLAETNPQSQALVQNANDFKTFFHVPSDGKVWAAFQADNYLTSFFAQNSNCDFVSGDLSYAQGPQIAPTTSKQCSREIYMQLYYSDGTMNVSPNGAPIGTTISVTGSGLTANSALSLTWDNTAFSNVPITTNPSNVKTDHLGQYNFTFALPNNAGLGIHTINATDVNTLWASAQVSVTAISISPSNGPVGTTVTVNGTGFTPQGNNNNPLTFRWDGTTLTTSPSNPTTNSTGGFTGVTFSVPCTTTGTHVINASDANSNWATALFTESSSPQCAPTNLSASTISSTQINLSWTAPSTNGGSAITGYKIQRSTDGGSTWPYSTNIGNVTSYSDTGLVHSTTYTYQVSAITGFGTGPPSSTASATTFNVVPSPPQGLTATPASSSQINLSWAAPVDNGGTSINGYKIERSTNGGTTWSTLVANTTNTATAYNDTSLAVAKTYTYRVSAINHVGTSSPSNTASATTDVTSTDTRLESSGEQRTSYFNGTINYEFYYNGTSANIFYRYSKDGGNTWSTPASTASGALASNSYFGVYGNSSVIISYASTSKVLAEKGTINNDGTIAWSSAVTVLTLSGSTPGQQYYPSFAQVGSTLFLEFNVNTKSGSKSGNFGYVYTSTNLGGSWSSQSINPMYSGLSNPAVVGIAKYGNTKALAMYARYDYNEFNYTTFSGTNWSSITHTNGAGLAANALKTQAFSITSNGTCSWVGYVPSNSGGLLKSAIFCGGFTFFATPITSTSILYPTISSIGNNIHLLYDRGSYLYRIISINQVWTPEIGSSIAHANIAFIHSEKSGYAGNHIPLVWKEGTSSPYAIGFASEDIDTDKDGIYNSWETNGIDYDGDGGIDLTLSGADPLRKDIFVEIDYMQGYKPNQTAINAVVAAFNKAPVSNPDGINGINLHVTTDDQIPLHTNMNIWNDFDSNKTTWFGTAAERSSPNSAAILNAKKFVYHYNLWIDQQFGTSSSGVSELPGNDFAVSLSTDVTSNDWQEGTFMHELGHNLGLHHGGNVDTNCKPNYLSVMSYSRQVSTFIANRNLDYSNSTLSSLDETNLSEPAGISATNPVQTTIFWNGATTQLTQTGIPVDWNGNGQTTDTGVVQDINNIPGTCATDGHEVENGYLDWNNLQYNFTGDRNFPNGAHSGIPEELTTNQMEYGLIYNIEIVDKMLSNTVDSDFVNAASAKDLKNDLHNKLMLDENGAYLSAKNHNYKNAIIALKKLRTEIIGSGSSLNSNHLIVNPKTQMKIIAHLDNAIVAFERFQNLPVDVSP